MEINPAGGPSKLTGIEKKLEITGGQEDPNTDPNVVSSSTTPQILVPNNIALQTLELLKTRRSGLEFAKLNEVIPFTDYLFNKVPQNPLLIRSSAQRTLDMLLSHGRTPDKKDGRELFRYHYFAHPPNPDDAISGNLTAIDDSVNEIARAANDSRRVILLAGPVGTSKTTMIRAIADGLEEYSKTEAGKMYSLGFDLTKVFDQPAIKNLILDSPHVECDIFEDPINLIPIEERRAFVKSLNEARLEKAKSEGMVLDYSLKSERKPCPHCQSIYKALLEIYEGDFEKAWEHVKAKRLILDSTERKGITFFGAKDEKSHKAKELWGDIDWTKVMRGASEGDPKALRLIGAITRANRGIVHFGELLKFPREILLPLLDVAQDRNINVINTLVGVDTLILASTNIPEVVDLARDKKHEATADRVSIVTVKYLDRISDEIGIYEKGFLKQAKARNIHVAPHTIELIASLGIATRLDEPKEGKIGRIEKVKLYDEKFMTGWTYQQVLDMKKDADSNELLTGTSPRELQNILEKTLGDVSVIGKENGSKCVNGYLVLEYFRRYVENPISKIDTDQKKIILSLIEKYKEEYDKKNQEIFRRASSGEPGFTQKMCERYIENADAYLEGKKVLDPTDRIEREPDEKLMRAIEEKREISEGRKHDFRESFVRKVGSLLRKGKEYRVQDDEPMARAIEDFLSEQHKNSLLPTVSKRETASKSQRAKADEIKKDLIKNHEACDNCADLIIDRAQAPHNGK